MINLSEEELSAIWYFQEISDNKYDTENWYTIENLIDRLQKELEKAKDLNEELQIRYNIEHDKYLKIKQELEQEKEKNKKLEGQIENLMQTIRENTNAEDLLKE